MANLYERRISRLFDTHAIAGDENFTGVDVATFRVVAGGRGIFLLNVTAITGTLNLTISSGVEPTLPFNEIYNQNFTSITTLQIPITDFHKLFNVTITVTGGVASYNLGLTLADNSSATDPATETTLQEIVTELQSLEVITTPGPEKFVLNGSDQDVTQDTGTPSNNRPLPVDLVDTAGQRGTTANPLQVKTVAGSAGSLQIKVATYGALSVSTTPVKVMVGAANLVNRIVVTMNPLDATVYMGFDDQVDASTGTPIEGGSVGVIDATDMLDVWLVAATGTVDVRITEGADQ